ncbi:MAG TPA: hypothetical protein VK348_05575, partial [Planctomycetota bacterium]|nr:hypothetical protein [Planctomycetota bacterium]
LRVQADGMMDFSDPSFVLPAAGSVREVTLTMTTGGTVFGVVKNLTPGAGARVLLTHTADHSRHTGAVDATTAEYRIVGLPAGGYFVNLMQFGDDDARRRMLANELAQRNRPSPDLAVQAGTSTRYDLIAGRDPLGSVAGTVMLNGIAAVGMQVRLNRLAEPNAAPRDSNAQDNQLANMTDQLLRATVDSNGAFTITTIPPGNYTAEVLRANGGGGRGGNFGGPPGGNNFGGRGLRGGGGVVDRQPLTILAFVQSSVQFDLRTSEVEFRLTLPDAIAATARTRIALALASEVGSQEPQQWRRLDSFRMLMIQNGTTGPQALAPGAYRYEAGGRGVQSQVGDLVVVAGQPQTLNLTMLAAPEGGPPDGSQPGGNPGNNPGGNAAPGPGGPGTPAAGNNPRAPGTPGAGNNPGAPGTPDAGNNPGGRGNNRRQGQRGQGGSPPNGGGSNNPPGGG